MSRCLLALAICLCLSTATTTDDEDCAEECAAVRARKPSTEEEEDIEKEIRMELLQLNLNVSSVPGGESLVKKGDAHADVGPSNSSLVQKKEGRRASCSSPANFDMSMACIADAVYSIPSGERVVYGWHLAAEAVAPTRRLGLGLGSGTDKIGTYSDGSGNCVLSFSGSDDVNDWHQAFDFIPERACNLDLHSGFYQELMSLTAGNPQWPEIKQFLQQNCEKTFFTGHSLGGAVASTLAACIEAGTEPALQGVPFDGVYTFGAPAISSTAAATADGSCFPGKRFFNLDAMNGGDPIPAVTDLLGLMKHPKMAAYRLINSFDWGEPRVEVFDCEQEDTWREPHSDIGPKPSLHYMSEYIQNMDAMV